MAESQNTEVTYLYRDTSNWKFWGTFVVKGMLQREELDPYLIRVPWMPSDIAWFVPNVVGLENLLTVPRQGDDDDLHELYEFTPTDRQDILCGAEQLVARFQQASKSGWIGRIDSLGP